ncbi:MAG: DPP IV N-terminal domain-containing protein [Ktedonobacterales bacterium]
MADQPPSPRFSVADIAAFPGPGMVVPNHFAFSHDNGDVIYLLASGEHAAQHMYALDLTTGATRVVVAPPAGGVQEEKLSLEEELRRQRIRMLATGVTSFSLAGAADRMLIPVNGAIYVRDGLGADATLRLIVESDSQTPLAMPALSPDGEQIAFVRDAELYVVAAAGGAPQQITSGARGTGKTNGLAEYVAQEELHRTEGFWWSADSRSIAYTEVDETHIPLYRIAHQGGDVPGETAEEAHRYPFAGQANAVVRLAVISALGGAPVWMDLEYDDDEEIYLFEVFWRADGDLGAMILNRAQTWVELVRFDAQTGQRTSVLHEETAYWINAAPHSHAQLKDGGFIWVSERSGFRQIYLYGSDGALQRQLTSGEWVVDAIKAVDEAQRVVYFLANHDDPTEMRLYAVSFDGDEPRRITHEAGTHNVTIDSVCQRFIDEHSALNTPPHVSVRSLTDGALLHAIEGVADTRIAAFALQPPEIVTLRNRDGVLLYSALYKPPADQFGAGPYPTIVSVYGGPGPQSVVNAWARTASLRIQYLRSLGYLVFQLDNRGSARRGVAFEGAIRRCMGTVEVDDQVDGVRWLVEQGLSDPQRVGVMGWSYGGYMALRCLEKAPDVFAVAVAGAPVTSWDGYDTAYTERYMSTPNANPAGYAEGSVLKHVDTISGKLLIVHGMLDENVHFRHTARLLNALIHAGKPFDLLPFPDERHMPRHPADRVYLEQRVISYFQQHL